MQTRICDCWLDVGQCKCEIINTTNERKQINPNGESNQEHHGDAASNPESDAKPKRPIDWDARDLKANGWLPAGGRKPEEGDSFKFWE
jgi:hypothetical protein